MSADPAPAPSTCSSPILDRALTASEVLSIEEHLARCSYCNDRYVFERALREQLKSCCSQEQAPPGLVERVRLRCRQADCS